MLEAFNFRVILEYLPLYGQCFLATLWLSGLSLLGAVVVGIIACAGRLSQSRILRGIAGVYIESIRSTPLLAQLYFFYFGLPSMGIMLPEWVTGVIALVLNSGAYYAEIIRAGIQAISFGQIEAGIASGLSYFQRMRYIILPQALGMTIRPMLGQAIGRHRHLLFQRRRPPAHLDELGGHLASRIEVFDDPDAGRCGLVDLAGAAAPDRPPPSRPATGPCQTRFPARAGRCGRRRHQSPAPGPRSRCRIAPSLHQRRAAGPRSSCRRAAQSCGSAGVGPVTALTYVLTIEDPNRFRKSRMVGAYLGLTPRRDQSGASDKQLRISKAGNGYLRRLLVTGAHYILGRFGPDCELKRFGLAIAARGGKNAKKRAAVAVARKLAVLLHRLWTSQQCYEPFYAAGSNRRAA